MKFVGVQLSYYLRDKKARRNIRSLLKYVAFISAVILIYAVLFHFIMLNVEHEQHSWVTGLYWTLTVMSTLGFGDITFESDIGRLFSIIVLLSGIVLLLIVLPFAFIRFFYAPLLESQTRMQAPRAVPANTQGHIIICSYNSIAPGLIRRLKQENIPYFVIEEDPVVATNWHLDGLSVISGEVDSEATYEALSLGTARMVVVNKEDTVNTKIILTIHHLWPTVPIVAVASEEESIDVLQLSGATHVLPLKRWLGEQLANRVSAGHSQAHPIGQYHDLVIAELAVHRTPFANKTVRETGLRQLSGVNIVSIWERGRMIPARPDSMITDSSVLVLIGSEEQMIKLDKLLVKYDINPNPVLVIGGGRVGAAAAHALKKRKIPVNLVEKDGMLCKRVKRFCDQVFSGDASDYHLLRKAGIMVAPSVVLTTNDDAMNVHLASYCRNLNPDLRIVSRITQERNIEVIHRAGADFVLSFASLGAEAIFSILKGKKLILLGEGVNLFSIPLPPSLSEKTLAETEIGARTGLTVIAIQQNGEVITRLSASTTLLPGSELLMLGDDQQRQDFAETYTSEG